MESGVWPGPNPQEETPPVGEGGGRREKEKDGGFGDCLWAQPPKTAFGRRPEGMHFEKRCGEACREAKPKGQGRDSRRFGTDAGEEIFRQMVFKMMRSSVDDLTLPQPPSIPA